MRRTVEPDIVTTLARRQPFISLPAKHEATTAAVVVTLRPDLAMATVLARKGRTRDLAERIDGAFHLKLPSGPRRQGDEICAFLGLGPQTWLATSESEGNKFAKSLTRILDDAAFVSDQSDGYVVLRLSGSKVRETLAKLIPLDLHARAFAVGRVASSVGSHIAMTLWRLDDNSGVPTFEIAVFRSFAESFWRALAQSASEFGLVVSALE